MPKSTGKAATGKPAKPRPDFPLFPHATGRWAKKVKGKLVYFGRVSDDTSGQAALEKWLDQKDDLLAGRAPRAKSDGLTLGELVNRFLTAKEMRVESGEIVRRTFEDYRDVATRLVSYFGKGRAVDDLRSEDFEAFRATITKTRGPVALGNDIARVRICFKWGYDAGILDKPMRYGQAFAKPSKRVLRREKVDRGVRMFEATQIRAMIEKATIPLRTMILLGINCGLGNNDCALLPLSALDLKAAWLRWPRPKTGIDRRCPLWPETVAALKLAIAERPTPKDEANAGLVFVTAKGKSWSKDKADNPISKEFRKLLIELGQHELGNGFYSLRRSFETVAGGSRDQIAVDHIMGHAPQSSDMSAVYRQRIEDERLQAVVKHVRAWLFPPKRRAK